MPAAPSSSAEFAHRLLPRARRGPLLGIGPRVSKLPSSTANSYPRRAQAPTSAVVSLSTPSPPRAFTPRRSFQHMALAFQHKETTDLVVSAVGFLSVQLAQLGQIGLIDELARHLNGSYELFDRSAGAGKLKNPPSLDAKLIKVNSKLSRLVDAKVEVEDVTLEDWRALVDEAASPTPNIEEHLGRYPWSLVTGKARARAKAGNETAKRMLQDFDGAKAEIEGLSSVELKEIAGQYRRS